MSNISNHSSVFVKSLTESDREICHHQLCNV